VELPKDIDLAGSVEAEETPVLVPLSLRIFLLGFEEGYVSDLKKLSSQDEGIFLGSAGFSGLALAGPFPFSDEKLEWLPDIPGLFLREKRRGDKGDEEKGSESFPRK